MDAAAIRQHYQNVKDTIDSAMESTEGLDVKGNDENKFLGEVRKQIGKINDDFKKEIDALEQSAEWDKFCIAFFGETNAGKSTLIDTLRICYDEQSRLESVLSNKKECNDLLERHSAEMEKSVKALEDIRRMASQATKQMKTLKIRAVVSFLLGILIGAILGIVVPTVINLWG